MKKPTQKDYVVDAILRRHKHLPANELPNLFLPRNRSEARRSLHGAGPFQHFAVRSPEVKKEQGRSRRKRTEARLAARV